MIRVESFELAPSIVGTMLERGEDPYKAIAAHVFDVDVSEVLPTQKAVVKRAVLRAGYGSGRPLRVLKVNVFGVRVWTSIRETR